MKRSKNERTVGKKEGSLLGGASSKGPSNIAANIYYCVRKLHQHSGKSMQKVAAFFASLGVVVGVFCRLSLRALFIFQRLQTL